MVYHMAKPWRTSLLMIARSGCSWGPVCCKRAHSVAQSVKCWVRRVLEKYAGTRISVGKRKNKGLTQHYNSAKPEHRWDRKRKPWSAPITLYTPQIFRQTFSTDIFGDKCHLKYLVAFVRQRDVRATSLFFKHGGGFEDATYIYMIYVGYHSLSEAHKHLIRKYIFVHSRMQGA